MALSSDAALWFLVLTLPICVWVAWNDMKFMKIPNKAVLALGAVFLVFGLIALPWAEYPWRLLSLAVVLVAGFLANLAGLVGAGDAKFAAVMAPFIPVEDARLFMILFAAVLLAAFVTHRLFRALPAIRAQTGDWESWTRKDFPMGLALGGSLAIYLGLGVFVGA
ncbi:MAG: prepilin peptidase [Rhodobacter sp.]|nr:prepilin peptidase [Rhodobacter sp.]